MDLLDLPAVKRLLVLNAGGHGDTLGEAVNCFKTQNTQHTILSKTDEAVKLGPAIDAAIRHQLLLRGVTTGQRVPEDWENALSSKLVRMSMRTSGASAYDPKINDLGFFFSHATSHAASQGRMDA
jgi:flagellar biosynthesis protein FlhF